MAAALGGLLVLEVDAGEAGALEGLNRPHNLQGLSEPGVGVADRRHLDRLGDVPGFANHLLHAQQPDVGVARGAVDKPRSGDVERLETGALGEHGHRSVEHSRHDDGLPGDGAAERRALPSR